MDDYRRTKYCPKLVMIQDKKKAVEQSIRESHPKAEDMHTYISNNSEKFKLQFIHAYNDKCAYCGVSIELLRKNSFEIDHFQYREASKFATKKEAGYIENLILACHDCNNNKGSLWIDEDQFDRLYPDGEGIKSTFVRDEQYYIRVNDLYESNPHVIEFYEKLQLGSELHRLDYLLMSIKGMQKKYQENKELYYHLGHIFDVIWKKRNIM